MLLLLTVMDDFFEVDVAGLLSRNEARRNERMKLLEKQSTQSLHALRSSSSGSLRGPNKKEEIRFFFDSLFGNLGLNLSKTTKDVERTHLTDYVYAKVRKLVL